MIDIQGQPITFDPKLCEDYCLTLANNTICGDYITNPTFDNNPITDWTIVKGTQFLERSFISNGAGAVTLSQSVTIPAGNYYLFYNFNCSQNFDFELTITNGPTAFTVFDTALGDESGGVLSFTLTGGSSRTVTIALDEVLSGNLIGTNYFYICKDDVLLPETDFCFQIPLVDNGNELLSSTVVDFVSTNASYAPAVTDTQTSVTTGNALKLISNSQNVITINQDGYYFFKYQIDSGNVIWGEDVDGVSKNIMVYYLYDGDEATESFNTGSLSGGFKSSTEWTPSVTGNIASYYRAYYEYDIVSTDYRIEYTMTGFETDMVRMFYEDTFTATDDTFYRLRFKNTNSTGTTVTISDSNGTVIMKGDSDGYQFDKIFLTGTLPTTTVTIRYELDNFVDYSSDTFYEDVLTEVSLLKQCSYSTDLENLSDVVQQTLTETHSTTIETTGFSYNQNIQYCLDLNSVTPGCYQLRATNDCLSTEDFVSNCINICNGNCTDEYKQLSWNHGNIKTVGGNIIDHENYTNTPFMWIKCDLQDLSFEEERENYIGSDGYWNTTWVRHEEVEVLQIWPVPGFVRRAITTGMMDVFSIDGVEYQKTEDDAFSPQFSARYNTGMRITVSRVGGHTISKN